MLDLPGHPLLKKDLLVGACSRLPTTCDASRLAQEVSALPLSLWGNRGGRVGVHSAAEAIFLRGYAPAEGDKPIEERPAMHELPYLRSLIHELIPAPPQRCLLARLGAGITIAPHIDRAPYFGKTLRLHVPVVTHSDALMYCDGQVYRMAAGEVWALNNSAVHAVWNQHAERSRTHLICDYLPSDGLLDLLAAADRTLGELAPDFEMRLLAHARSAASDQ